MRKLAGNKFSIFYITTLLGLFLYSFTQIDLGLALTRFPAFFTVQRAFQSIGYFNRPLSALFFTLILLMLFVSYFYLLYLTYTHKLNRKHFWKLVLLPAILLTFTYNAFSYDIFNYIFDAKIFTYYGQNPYLHKALDFPQDPMLGFMHWTHRTFPYGPVWLAVSVLLSYAGANIFLLTFLFFKLLAAGSYLGSVYIIEKILQKTEPKRALFGTAFFVFNPLVLIEGLVSAHIDMFMIFLALLGFYYLITKKYYLVLIFILLSIGTKYATVFLVPVFLSVITMQAIKENVPWRMFIGSAIACLAVAVIAASEHSGNFQPWYLLTLLPFIAMIANNPYLFSLGSIGSLGALLTYLPFIYLGNWDNPVPEILKWLYLTTLSVSLLAGFIYVRFFKKKGIFLFKAKAG